MERPSRLRSDHVDHVANIVEASRRRQLARAAVLAVGLAVAGTAACGTSSSSTSTSGDGPVADAKELSASKKEYVGNWTGEGTTLSISSDGDVAWKSEKGGVSSSYSGKLKKFKGDSLLIDAMVEVNLVVTKAPHEDGGAWKMTMEGVEVTRVDRVAGIAKMLQENFAKQGAAVKGMTCKGKAPVGEKSMLDCEIVSEGGEKAAVDVEVTADGTATTKTKPGHVFFLGAKVNELFDKELASKVEGVEGIKGGCPNVIHSKKVGESISCPALVGDKQHGTITATAEANENLGIRYAP